MSADLLREAAAKMRELAEAATPGPWAWEPPSDDPWPQAEESLVAPGDDWQPDRYFGGCSEFLREFHGTRVLEDGSHEHRTTNTVVSGWGYDASGTDASDEDRAYIAAWHPTIALAVADWLTEQASAIDMGEDDNWPPQTAAIRVARAYLNRPSP